MDVIATIAHKHTKVTPESPVVVELPRKGACLESVFWRQVHAVEFGEPHRAPVPEPHGRVAHYHSTVHRFESESSVDITADAVPELNRFSPVA